MVPRTEMKLQSVQRAWSYIRENADRLMKERPGDAELAAELTKELAPDSYTACNANTLRCKCPVFITREVEGKKIVIPVTWKPTGGWTKPKGDSYLKNNMQLSADLLDLTKRVKANETNARDDIIQLERRIQVLENVLRDLGARV